MSEFERLTWRTTVGTPNFDMADNIRKDNIARSAFYQKVCDRLAAYEDSGLSSEEVRELAKAKVEGRLVVLPLKVGNTVYKIWYKPCHNGNTFPDGMTCDGCEDTCDIERAVIPEKISHINQILNRLDYFGKTVFLTREEAEKAIGGETERGKEG